jgi:hypothetical protein
MTPIKIILIALLVIVLRAFLVQKSLVLAKRLFVFILFFLLLFLVVFPDVSTRVAKVIGVGRGVDLIFYLSHLFLLFLIAGLWRRCVALDTSVTELSRIIALQNANKPQKRPEEPYEKLNDMKTP